MKQGTLFGGQRAQMHDSIDAALASLQAYGERYEHWAIAWSGGKDSSALVTFVVWALLAGKIPRPRTLTVLYADTRMEILPLWLAAKTIQAELDEHAAALSAVGVELSVRTVVAPLDRRFMVYMLGRGVPPPNGNTLRWCTRQIKIEPMAAALRELVAARGGAKALMLTGVRVGESQARDGRISLSCSAKNGAECGQGWFQETLPAALCDTLAPLLNWRVCHVWEWLRTWAPRVDFGDFSTEIIAEAYGGDEAEESSARTGCVECPLVEEDRALEGVIRLPGWGYLAPLRKLKPLYRELREPSVRLRKPGGETRADGSLVANQQRLGPLTLVARRDALARVLAIQTEVNNEADRLGRERIDILNAEEAARIEGLIAAGAMPQRWSGDEPTGDVELDRVFADGSVQPLLFPARGR